MKVTLAALNASYTHTSLACAYLKSFCQDPRWCIDIMEFTINDHYRSILSRLFAAQSDIYGFSCYIWNVEMVKKLCNDLKLARPDCFIVLGGPKFPMMPMSYCRKIHGLMQLYAGKGN